MQPKLNHKPLVHMNTLKKYTEPPECICVVDFIEETSYEVLDLTQDSKVMTAYKLKGSLVLYKLSQYFVKSTSKD